MELHPFPPEEAAVRRYVEELWIPYNRDLEAVVDDHALVDDVALVEEEVEFRIGVLERDDHRAWIAVDGADELGGDVDLATVDGEFAGFVGTGIDEAPTVFDRPDRLILGDIYVKEPYRGSGLATDLMARAVARAESEDCPEVILDVDVDNERALAFYDKLGFEPYRHRMTAEVTELAGRLE